MPVDSHGDPLVYAEYGDAKYDLVQRLGPFCTYCERRLATHIAVEHIEARYLGGAVIDWNNFLLACTNCNSSKGIKPLPNPCFLPDRFNTAYAFEYGPGAMIAANVALASPQETTAANDTLDLFGLRSLMPMAPRQPDRRWDDYIERWGNAEISLQRWQSKPTSELREQIAETAQACGAFSIYMTVFKKEPAVRQEILDRFQKYNTRLRCFDTNANVQSDLNL
jgi:hypothetical protein